MRPEPAGDVDYEADGSGYAEVRRPEPRFEAAVRLALGGARTLVNVGAGAGSYEPADMEVTPVEPSAAMRAQRPPSLAPAVDATAEDLPFADGAFDAALASVTIHQWRDLERGLAEVRRVTRGPVVILTFDPVALHRFWLTGYAPDMMAHECGRMPPLDRVVDGLGGRSTVDELPIPFACSDGFVEAFFGRPESLLDGRVRRAQSAWSFVGRASEQRAVDRLAEALDTGEWDAAHGGLRRAAEYHGALRLVTAHRA
ncbi:MAG: class I SAM-dependent methyltransferase [Acidimicrobiales bacterium]